VYDDLYGLDGPEDGAWSLKESDNLRVGLKSTFSERFRRLEPQRKEQLYRAFGIIECRAFVLLIESVSAVVGSLKSSLTGSMLPKQGLRIY
jgi:hypothetical protein